ncbi:universal stress protein [Rhodobacteraceae bacterium HSP-20]|uniref:Universal stress protein n=1 Tax=Paragemmobacter amnigenus TaxID=2852097 RepID=A0ABS6J2B5_9RHOB|nr:universal stress protein [Rhodobacter amnigenus]MBU9697381.1 universal stress protein [Rhodobacter amnigenus]MBV4388608.1 universal stress protein [Rhodobacter amnigenus]
MAYKTLLTVAVSATRTDAAITGAAALAAAHDAHLDILALGVDRTQIGYSYVGTGAVVLQAALDRAEQDAKEIESAARKAIAGQSPALRYTIEAAMTQLGALTDLVAQRARFADLVILSRPYGDGQGPEAEAVTEAALFEGRAPVLILPDSGAGRAAAPRRAVIAWNQSAEAMTAVRKALPLLKQADLVNIAVIDPPQHGPERSDPGGMLCQMLVRHGVRAEVSVLARTLPRISDVLARHVRDQNADLLVMGAYGHSRFREAILGGATRNMLEQAEVPVFMAH